MFFADHCGDPGSAGAPGGKLVGIVGPTAVGKSAVGLILAERLGGEMVTADSMQVYRGLDIGTAKPSLEEQRLVPHHLIDVVDPSEVFDARQYQALARETIASIQGRGSVPLLVGGTGLYVRAVVDELDFPPRDATRAIRAEFEERARAEGHEGLHRELVSLDPEAAERIPAGNVRRVIRALEVIRLTGKPFSDQTRDWPERRSRYDLRLFGLTMDRRELYARIDRRVEQQLEAGLLGEVEELVRKGYAASLTSRQAICYKELLEYLEGRLSFEEAVDLIKRRNRHYAKRQLTWFRRDPRVEWYDITGLEPRAVSERLFQALDKPEPKPEPERRAGVGETQSAG